MFMSLHETLLIHPIDTADNLPSIFELITKGFESHSKAVEFYNEMLSCIESGCLYNAHLSENKWKRRSKFSTKHLSNAIAQLETEYRMKHKNETWLEATILKSKLTQDTRVYMSFQSMDPDKTNKINGEMLESFSFGKPNTNPNPIRDRLAPALHTAMRYRTRQPRR